MRRGGYLAATDGFTIVEVLIVLAVSALLLVSAITLIDGRQAKAEFTTGVNDELQQLQQVINETASGYYPNSGDFTCNGNPPDPVILNLAPRGSTSQGTNSGCIFLGKAMQFGTTGLTTPTGSTLSVLPVIGNQYENTGGVLTSVLSVGASVPRALFPESASENSNVPTDTATSETIENGLQLATGNSACGLTTIPVCYSPASGGGFVATGVAAFLAGDSSGTIAATAAGSSTNLQSGQQQLSLYGVQHSSANESQMAASAAMYNATLAASPGNFIPAKEVLICVADSDTNESGLFTISGNGSLSVTLKVIDDLTC